MILGDAELPQHRLAPMEVWMISTLQALLGTRQDWVVKVSDLLI